MMFSTNVIIYFLTSFMVFIIESPDFYDVPSDKAGQELGNIGFYAEILAIVEGIFIGMLFDTIGRRLLISLGIALCGISIALIPLFKQVYPFFLILRILISVGLIPAVNNPLLPDYVVVSSQGRGSAYMSILTSCGYIFSTSLLIQVSKSVEL